MQASATENPVLELLLLCTRPQISDDPARRILAIVGGEPEWNALTAAAAEHSLTSLVCKNLEACAGEALPLAWRQRFSQEFLHSSCRNLAITAELFRVLEGLESRGVCATPYKGPVLAAQAHGDIALREFSDLDIIVPQRQIAAAHKALLALGFRSEISGLEAPESSRRIPGQYAYHKKTGTTVELHTERTLRYFPRGLKLGELCQRRKPVMLAGRQVLTFSLEDTLLLLSVHGSKHLWERLGWVADIAALTVNSRPDWALVLDRAQSWGIQRMVLLGAGLAGRLFDTALPDEAANCLRQDKVARRLIDEISRRFFSVDPIRFGVFRRFAFRVQMRGSIAQGVPYAVRLALMPTEHDRGRLRYLDPLYAVLRPLRLARTYGWRTRVGP